MKAIELSDVYTVIMSIGRKLKRKKQVQEKKAQEKEERLLYDKIMPLFQDALKAEDENDIDEAIDLYEEILDMVPDHVDSLYNIGWLYYKKDKFRQAINAYKKVTKLDPEDHGAFNNLGIIYHDAKKLRRAEKAFKKTIELDPDYYKAYSNLANVLQDMNRSEEALESIKKAVELRPKYAEGWNNYGNVLWDLGKLEDAKDAYQHAIDLKPDYSRPYSNYAKVLCEQNRREEAAVMFRKTLELRPDYPSVMRSLTSCVSYTDPDHEDAERIRKFLLKPDLDEAAQTYLYFGLGKIYQDCELYDKAFAHYQEGNILRDEALHFTAKKFNRYIKSMLEVFTPEYMESHGFKGLDSDAPVFVVGLPRAGKTLVEQIITHHPQIGGVEEMVKLQEFISRMPDLLEEKLDDRVKYPRCMPEVEQSMITDMAHEYKDRILRDMDDSILRVANTMPYNYLHLGFISMMFPNARIIHCYRHPLDNALFIYFKYFASGNDYAYTQENIVTYYAGYSKIMDLWRKTKPLNMLEVPYERTVSDTHGTAERIINFLGVDWDEHCMPDDLVHSKEIERWTKLEPFLEPLIEGMQPYIKKYEQRCKEWDAGDSSAD